MHTGEKRRVHVTTAFGFICSYKLSLNEIIQKKQSTAPSSKLKCKPHINTNECIRNFRDYFKRCGH